MTYLLLVIGLAALVIGANWLVDGSASIARRWGLSEYLIGATIVGMGTSTPELVVSLVSSMEGHADIAIGNVVGSNIFNTFLILGVTALICPIAYTRDNIRKDIPMYLATCILVILLCYSERIMYNGPDELGRLDGVILLLLFIGYVYWVLKTGKDTKPASKPNKATEEKQHKLALDVGLIVIGLAGLIFGGDLLVKNASAIARQMGISEAFIGLTIVAGGTSLPELASSVAAVLKGKNQLALGNIIGSNIFNILLILGVSSVVNPLHLGNITWVDMGVMLLTPICLFLVSFSFKRKKLDRGDAIFFLAIYVAYIVYLSTTMKI